MDPRPRLAPAEPHWVSCWFHPLSSLPGAWENHNLASGAAGSRRGWGSGDPVLKAGELVLGPLHGHMSVPGSHFQGLGETMELLVLGGDAAHSQGLLGSMGQVPGKTLSSSGVGAGHRDRPWGCLSCQCPVSPTLRGAYGLSWGVSASLLRPGRLGHVWQPLPLPAVVGTVGGSG